MYAGEQTGHNIWLWHQSKGHHFFLEIFKSKVNIWNVNCMCESNSVNFRLTNGCSCESVKHLETENILTWGGLEPPILIGFEIKKKLNINPN